LALAAEMADAVKTISVFDAAAAAAAAAVERRAGGSVVNSVEVEQNRVAA
jgi:cobalamin biosynthesis protein CbiD